MRRIATTQNRPRPKNMTNCTYKQKGACMPLSMFDLKLKSLFMVEITENQLPSTSFSLVHSPPPLLFVFLCYCRDCFCFVVYPVSVLIASKKFQAKHQDMDKKKKRRREREMRREYTVGKRNHHEFKYSVTGILMEETRDKIVELLRFRKSLKIT